MGNVAKQGWEEIVRQVRKERDEAQELVFRIGLRLRQHYRDDHQCWTPEAAWEIYRWIDDMERQMTPLEEKR